MPPRHLWGLLPHALLEDFDFYHDLMTVSIIRGYPKRPATASDDSLLTTEAKAAKKAEERLFRLLPQPATAYAETIEIELEAIDEEETANAKLKQAMAKKRAGKLPAISSRRKDKVKEKKTTGGEEHVRDAAAPNGTASPESTTNKSGARRKPLARSALPESTTI